MTKWIIGIIVLVVLGVGAYWLYQNNEGEGLTQEEPSSIHANEPGSAGASVNVNASSSDQGMPDNGVRY